MVSVDVRQLQRRAPDPQNAAGPDVFSDQYAREGDSAPLLGKHRGRAHPCAASSYRPVAGLKRSSATPGRPRCRNRDFLM